MNHPTQIISIWINNDESLYNQIMDFKDDITSEFDSDDAINKLANTLECWINELNPLENENNIFSDLLDSILEDVDYNELAEDILSD